MPATGLGSSGGFRGILAKCLLAVFLGASVMSGAAPVEIGAPDFYQQFREGIEIQEEAPVPDAFRESALEYAWRVAVYLHTADASLLSIDELRDAGFDLERGLASTFRVFAVEEEGPPISWESIDPAESRIRFVSPALLGEGDPDAEIVQGFSGENVLAYGMIHLTGASPDGEPFGLAFPIFINDEGLFKILTMAASQLRYREHLEPGSKRYREALEKLGLAPSESNLQSYTPRESSFSTMRPFQATHLILPVVFAMVFAAFILCCKRREDGLKPGS